MSDRIESETKRLDELKDNNYVYDGERPEFMDEKNE